MGKKIARSIFIVFLSLSLALCIGCGGGGSSTETTPSDNDNNTDNSGSGSDVTFDSSDIIGTWISTSVDGVQKTNRMVTFNLDGTATSNCGDNTNYSWTVTNGSVEIELASSGDSSYCSTDNCTSITLDSTGMFLTTTCDRTTVF